LIVLAYSARTRIVATLMLETTGGSSVRYRKPIVRPSSKAHTILKRCGERTRNTREERVSLATELRRSGAVDAAEVADPLRFDPRETHGICKRPGWRLHGSSAASGWRNLFVSSQTETPEEADYGSVRHHLLVVQLNGQARVSLRVAGRSAVKQMAAGDSTLVPGGEGFTVRLFNTFDTAHIYLRREMIERVIDERCIATTSPPMQPFFGIRDPLIEHLALASVAALDKPSKSTSFYVDHLAWALAAHLIETHGRSSAPPKSHYQGLTDRQLKRAEEFMVEHLEGDLSVEELAAAASLSPVYFARQFKLRTGSSPHRYLRSLRIKRAKQLLRNDCISIAEIAFDCGFCHQEHMTRVFRAECGTTPAAFRRGSD
jgi:AraC family transcriptional regulator